MKNIKTEFFLCLFGGYLGLHKFYKGKIMQGILYAATLGLFTVGWIIDSIKLYKIVFKISPEEREEIFEKESKKRKLHEEKKMQRKIEREKKFQEELEKIQEDRQRIANMKKEGIVFCPKCKSTCVTYTEKHKKLSIGRAVIGGALAGETGAILGGLTSKKVKGRVKCLNCGYEWKPGKR